MSGVALRTACMAHLRASFSKTQLAQVLPYGGQFNAQEIDFKSYTCPAVLVASRGFRPNAESKTLTGRHIREVQLSAFVLTKGGTREQRMDECELLAEQIAHSLVHWAPTQAEGQPFELGHLLEEPVCENLYNRAIDAKGQAMWVLHWQQDIHIYSQPQLFAWLQTQVQSTAIASGNTLAPLQTTITMPQ